MRFKGFSPKRYPFICFVHIEKCGGITFHSMMHQEMMGYISPNPRFGEVLEPMQLRAIKKLYPISLQGIGGHRMAPYLEYEKVVEKEILYVTMFRDPINRFLSHLNWQKNVMGRNWTLESFSAEGYFDDFQCYRISGKRSAKNAISVLEEKPFLIGLVEEFDLSMVMLQKLYPHFSLKYEKQNVKSYDPGNTYRQSTLSPKQMDIVKKSNEQDIILFEYVKSKFEDKKKSMPDWEKTLSQYREGNSGYKLPLYSLVKRKLSNAMLTYLIQPSISKKVD